jgi:hypothetical protein
VAFTSLWDYITFQRGARLITRSDPAINRSGGEATSI